MPFSSPTILRSFSSASSPRSAHTRDAASALTFAQYSLCAVVFTSFSRYGAFHRQLYCTIFYAGMQQGKLHIASAIDCSIVSKIFEVPTRPLCSRVIAHTSSGPIFLSPRGCWVIVVSTQSTTALFIHVRTVHASFRIEQSPRGEPHRAPPPPLRAPVPIPVVSLLSSCVSFLYSAASTSSIGSALLRQIIL